MKLFFKAKDGGPESEVTGWWLIESKKLFSIVLLRFTGISRPAFHTHAFDAWSWVMTGELIEVFRDGKGRPLRPSFRPVPTPRDTFHQVRATGRTAWVLSFRGPWQKRWKEYLELEDRERYLESGRVEVKEI